MNLYDLPTSNEASFCNLLKSSAVVSITDDEELLAVLDEEGVVELDGELLEEVVVTELEEELTELGRG